MSDEPCDPDSDNPADWSLQHHPDRPYLNGEPIRTGDRVAFVDIDGGRTEGIAHVDSAIEWNRDVGHATRVAIIPDGEPWKYGRDYAFASAAADADLTFTAHRWLKGDPIPYDEMRRLCGLPDIKAIDAQRKKENAALLIYMLTRATDKIPVYRGPNQFPSYQDLRGPMQWIRYEVLLDALGTGLAFDEAAAVALRKDLTDEQRAVVLEQCAFIREHTEPRKPWLMWANPFLPAEFNTFAKTKQERAYSPHAVQVDVGGRTPQWMIGVGLVEPEPETPKQRALPRPSTTPPPWADNPAGQRRPTKTRNHRRVK